MTFKISNDKTSFTSEELKQLFHPDYEVDNFNATKFFPTFWEIQRFYRGDHPVFLYALEGLEALAKQYLIECSHFSRQSWKMVFDNLTKYFRKQQDFGSYPHLMKFASQIDDKIQKFEMGWKVHTPLSPCHLTILSNKSITTTTINWDDSIVHQILSFVFPKGTWKSGLKDYEDCLAYRAVCKSFYHAICHLSSTIHYKVYFYNEFYFPCVRWFLIHLFYQNSQIQDWEEYLKVIQLACVRTFCHQIGNGEVFNGYSTPDFKTKFEHQMKNTFHLSYRLGYYIGYYHLFSYFASRCTHLSFSRGGTNDTFPMLKIFKSKGHFPIPMPPCEKIYYDANMEEIQCTMDGSTCFLSRHLKKAFPNPLSKPFIIPCGKKLNLEIFKEWALKKNILEYFILSTS